MLHPFLLVRWIWADHLFLFIVVIFIRKPIAVMIFLSVSTLISVVQPALARSSDVTVGVRLTAVNLLPE